MRKLGIFLSIISVVAFMGACTAENAPSQQPMAEFACQDPEAAESLMPLVLINGGGTTTAPYVDWGIKNGCFAQHGLEVTALASVGPANAEKLAALVGGNADIAAESPAEVLTAMANTGTALRIVAGSNEITQTQLAEARNHTLLNGEFVLETVVIARSGVEFKGASDLIGKRFGSVPGGGSAQLGTDRFLIESGLSPSEVEWIPLAAAERLDAFKRGDLDFVQLTGVGAYEALDSGGTIAYYPQVYVVEPGATFVWYTTAAIAQEKEGELRAFQDAIRHIHALITEPDYLPEFKDFLEKGAGLDSTVIARYRVPNLPTRGMTREEFEYLVPVLIEAGAIPPDFEIPPDIVF